MKDELFLGCRLRISTRAQVRYEGQLYTIDPSHQTLSLANVQAIDSPASNLYEYITFRASDVLDMTVLPQPDFDFASANAKLQRPQPPAETTSQPKSFFDHFSEGKDTRRHNAETFGQNRRQDGRRKPRKHPASTSH